MSKLRLFLVLILSVTFLIPLFLSCGNDDNPTQPPDTFDIVGIWEVTEVEGTPSPVNSSNSTWTFNADGTYEWFFLFEDIFDLSSEGNYSLNESVLTCDGFITNVTGTTIINITISNNNNTFSFLDEDGDRWTYNRAQ